jgi:hypothetical protein
MKKLKLEIESLSVVSFSTTPAAAGRGTVQAHGPSANGCVPGSFDCTAAVECEVTSGINSCWCSEMQTCFDCTPPE